MIFINLVWFGNWSLKTAKIWSFGCNFTDFSCIHQLKIQTKGMFYCKIHFIIMLFFNLCNSKKYYFLKLCPKFDGLYQIQPRTYQQKRVAILHIKLWVKICNTSPLLLQTLQLRSHYSPFSSDSSSLVAPSLTQCSDMQTSQEPFLNGGASLGLLSHP